MANAETALGLAHELMLLSLDARGVERTRLGTAFEAGLAGGLILELLEAGALNAASSASVTASSS